MSLSILPRPEQGLFLSSDDRQRLAAPIRRTEQPCAVLLPGQTPAIAVSQPADIVALHTALQGALFQVRRHLDRVVGDPQRAAALLALPFADDADDATEEPPPA